MLLKFVGIGSLSVHFAQPLFTQNWDKHVIMRTNVSGETSEEKFANVICAPQNLLSSLRAGSVYLVIIGLK
jgi:hypothetical protein